MFSIQGEPVCPELGLGRVEDGKVKRRGSGQSAQLFVMQREFIFCLSLMGNHWSV